MTEHATHAGQAIHGAAQAAHASPSSFLHQMSAPPDPGLVADGFVLSLFIVLGIVFAIAPLAVGYLLSPRAKNRYLGEIYECGMPAFGEAISARFGVFYYMYALIFIVFEVDVLYLFPIARIYRQGVGLAGFIEVLVFVFILFMAIVYAWKKGVWIWEREALSLR